MALFPSWFPTEPMLLFFVVLVAAVLVMNMDRSWMFGRLATSEPIIVALGVLVIAGNQTMSAELGGRPKLWMIVGAVVSLFGLIAWRSENVDVSGLFG